MRGAPGCSLCCFAPLAPALLLLFLLFGPGTAACVMRQHCCTWSLYNIMSHHTKARQGVQLSLCTTKATMSLSALMGLCNNRCTASGTDSDTCSSSAGAGAVLSPAAGVFQGCQATPVAQQVGQQHRDRLLEVLPLRLWHSICLCICSKKSSLESHCLNWHCSIPDKSLACTCTVLC